MELSVSPSARLRLRQIVLLDIGEISVQFRGRKTDCTCVFVHLTIYHRLSTNVVQRLHLKDISFMEILHKCFFEYFEAYSTAFKLLALHIRLKQCAFLFMISILKLLSCYYRKCCFHCSCVLLYVISYESVSQGEYCRER